MGKSRNQMVEELNQFCDGFEVCGLGKINCPLFNFVEKFECCDFETLDDEDLEQVYNVMLADKDMVAVRNVANKEYVAPNAKLDMVNHPNHYNQGKVECIDAMAAATVNKRGIEAICVSNVIKYLFRYEAKNGLEDVKKAQFYLNRLIDELEGK